MKRGKQIAITAIIFFALLTIPIVLQVIEKTTSSISFIANDETLEFETTTKYALTPTVKGEIKSIKITGKVLGEGQVKVLLGDKIIFDNYLEDQETITIAGNVITGFIINDSNSSEANETNSTEVNITTNETTETNVTVNETNSTEVNITTNETTDTTTEETTETDETTDTTTEETTETNVTVNETNTTEILEQIKEVQIIETPTPETSTNGEGSPAPTFDESIQKEFEKECKDTCKLKDMIFREEYILEIIIENSKLIIYEIEYEIVPTK